MTQDSNKQEWPGFRIHPSTAILLLLAIALIIFAAIWELI